MGMVIQAGTKACMKVGGQRTLIIPPAWATVPAVGGFPPTPRLPDVELLNVGR